MSTQSIIKGLLAEPPQIEPKYFYDEVGSRLFELLTLMPEYYPTRTEQSLMRLHSREIAQTLGEVGVLIDLGAGNCHKARDLFATMQPKQYVAVDISATFLEQALDEMRASFPDIRMQALAADLTKPIALPSNLSGGKRVCFYPGSSIGNFDPGHAVQLMKEMRELVEQDNDSTEGGLLIGVDLVKDTAVLRAAYNDELGLTAAFNRNMLTHINRLLGSDFNLADWGHDAFFNEALSRIEMHLYARRDLTVHWPQADGHPAGQRFFASGESIHTENSYKYQTDFFAEMLAQAGFSSSQFWTDPARQFAVFYACA
jgi:dimethylhistidine N-methyltransferase